jgi:capsular exopolysaccharide synthesis family protein
VALVAERPIGLKVRWGRKSPTAPRVVRDEAMRVMRTNLLVALEDLDSRVVVVTSSFQGEGKTSTCVGLARSLVAAGQRVVVVDLDLRHPDAGQQLGCRPGPGASEVLQGRVAAQDALQRVTDPYDRPLYVLPAGAPVPNPAELLSADRAGRLLGSISAQASIVLIDSPPVLPVADTLVIGRLAAGAILVVEAGRTPVAACQRAKDSLIRNQCRLLGVALNRMESTSADEGYGYGETLEA